MNDTARDYQIDDPAPTDGLDDFFCEGGSEAPQEGDTQGLPVEKAAKILGISQRTVLKRLRKGSLAGFKISTKFGEKWVVSPEAIPQDSTIPLDVEEEPVTASTISVCETTNDEPLAGDTLGPPSEGLSGAPLEIPSVALSYEQRSTDSADMTSRILDMLEQQSKELQAANWRNGHLETRVQDLESQLVSKSEEIKLLMDSQHKSGKWARFKAWFFGQ
ncbi:MAG: helix-turn-helix domain-containing protein [Anaerolineae bacterium]|nr:helix-turn-helix domain-containing protein [Anaerolineae bacterium]